MDIDSPVDIREYTELVGQDLPQPQQYNYEVTRDSIRHFAHAVDDHNALYVDDEFARSTPWGGIIAPPGYLASHGSAVWLTRLVPHLQDRDGRLLSSFVHASEEWSFDRPARPGTTVLSHSRIAEVQAKQGRKSGPSVLIRLATRYTDAHGQQLATRWTSYFRVSPSKPQAGENGRHPPLAEGSTRNVILPTRFPGTFELPANRRDAARYFSDVSVGEELEPLKLGPFMLQHLGRYNAATMGTGVDEVGGRSPDGSMPDAYVFGHMRIPWFGTLLTRWGGPGAWVCRISQRDTDWLLIGFTVFCKGRVLAKSPDTQDPWIDVELWCETEYGVRTNEGRARVRLADSALPGVDPR